MKFNGDVIAKFSNDAIMECDEFETSSGAVITVMELVGPEVRLNISGAPAPCWPDSAFFRAEDIKQLQEFLNKLLAQIEAPQTDFTDPVPAAQGWEADEVEAQSSTCLSDVAKRLNWKPHAFIKQLEKDGVLFKG